MKGMESMYLPDKRQKDSSVYKEAWGIETFYNLD